jgi:hypothetical protein
VARADPREPGALMNDDDELYTFRGKGHITHTHVVTRAHTVSPLLQYSCTRVHTPRTSLLRNFPERRWRWPPPLIQAAPFYPNPIPGWP